jgi:multidrug efflux system membrane fusion protein
VVNRGLAAGEKIVVNGLQRVRPGAAITPQPVAMRVPASEEGQRRLASNP